MKVNAFWFALWVFVPGIVRADDFLVRYEAEALPYASSVPWLVADPCVPPCSESVLNGHLFFRWPLANDNVGYGRFVALPPEIAPSSLWVEWRFRSNHPIGPIFDACDGRVSIKYRQILEVINMYGDWARSFEGSSTVSGLALNQFHTYRFESHNGSDYCVSVNGFNFIVDSMTTNDNGYADVQFSGRGGCNSDQFPNMENAWDFIRYGTISYGEAVVDSDPPMGDVSAVDYPDRTRFTVTFDSPNYVYVDEIRVSVTDFAGVTPVAPMNYPMVLQTRRLDNGPPEVVEIVLDKTIPHAATTTFTLTDGVATNIIEYTLSPGDADGDGVATLADFAHFQNCFRAGTPSAFCRTFDLNRDGSISLGDHQLFVPFMFDP